MSYTPDAVDVVWIDFDPQAGHEQAKCRPAAVSTPKILQRKNESVYLRAANHESKKLSV